jgi:hypothetical protein
MARPVRGIELSFRRGYLLAGAAGIGLAVISDLPPLDAAAAVNLVLHHVQHVLILFGGFSVGYALTGLYASDLGDRWASFKDSWARLNRGGYLAGALFFAVFTFWHVPAAFTYTVLPGNEPIHFLEHSLFFASALILAAAIPFMSRTFKSVYIFVFGNMNSMMGVLYSVWGSNLFAPYPFSQQDQFGLVMSVSGFFTMTMGTFAYVLLSEWRLNSSRSRVTEGDGHGSLS